MLDLYVLYLSLPCYKNITLQLLHYNLLIPNSSSDFCMLACIWSLFSIVFALYFNILVISLKLRPPAGICIDQSIVITVFVSYLQLNTYWPRLLLNIYLTTQFNLHLKKYPLQHRENIINNNVCTVTAGLMKYWLWRN